MTDSKKKPPAPVPAVQSVSGADTDEIAVAVLEQDPRHSDEWDEADPKKTLGLVLDHLAKERIAQMRRDKERDDLIAKLAETTSELADSSGERSSSTTNRILLIVGIAFLIIGSAAGVTVWFQYNPKTGEMKWNSSSDHIEVPVEEPAKAP